MDDQELLDNVDGRMHGPMSWFIKRYFGNLQCDPQDATLSTTPSPDDFLEWFPSHASGEFDGARGSWQIPEHDDGARLLLTIPASPASDDGLLRLCRSAYEVFTSQPTRLFLHGFYIRGSLTELWVFGRSGLYCSDVFDTQKNFVQFLSIIRSYQRLTDQELGKLAIIEMDEGGSYITLDSVEIPALGKLYLEAQPIASRERLVGTGTTCYRARTPNSDRWDYVLKFKWRWVRDRPEDELLKLASKKCVWSLVSLDYYKEVESTSNLRRRSCFNAAGLVDYTEETGDFFQNRILACVVTSPVGRPLGTFHMLLELLQVFRDSIKCHRSLYHGAKILHQDISPGNIIILDGQDEQKPKGILIDLDSAIELAELLETERGITGTRPFIAIGVLKKELHSYRHDLESSFYVFLWTIITNHADDPPETSKLRQWSKGEWEELAVRKSLDMCQDSFHSILEEFKVEFESLKPVAKRLHRILFPMRDGIIWTETDGSPEAVDKLYDGMIEALEEAIALEGRR
ncbi:hypothetical protein VE01_08637 [Pseudogymnoascus verrucosus]|uniref:Fungal-type protein kinase domain-containing protein n=1 Tax=Pseudogymnoascus verrucosus TaxID=342668 RepID=A0A1B8GAX9_9PEZI|nr:uncharacterized protein VE01_08637 [Pseudogymnoascus verrucosus]OBT92993.1 hypothetical protein VE01_08637 [Pseudogymnoascus verrucosus]